MDSCREHAEQIQAANTQNPYSHSNLKVYNQISCRFSRSRTQANGVGNRGAIVTLRTQSPNPDYSGIRCDASSLRQKKTPQGKGENLRG